jgi:hypothetical protein
MTNCHRPQRSPASAEIARHGAFRKNIFEKTNPRLESRHPKTTTYGRKSRFQLFSNCHNCTTFSPTILLNRESRTL